MILFQFRFANKFVIPVFSKFSMKIFTELFHDLCDAIESINQLFTFHLSPAIFFMLVIDIFGAYGIIREFISTSNQDVDGNDHNAIYLIFSNVIYSGIQLMFKIWAASIGHTTTSEAERTKVILAKLMNRMSPNSVSRCNFYSAIMQCQTRNLKLQNQFFVIDWNIVFAVTPFKYTSHLNLIISDVPLSLVSYLFCISRQHRQQLHF